MHIQTIEMMFYHVKSSLFSSKEEQIKEALHSELSSNVDFVYDEVKSLPEITSKPPFLSTTSTLYLIINYNAQRSWNIMSPQNLERMFGLFKKVEDNIYEDNIDINYVREKNNLRLTSFPFQSQINQGKFVLSDRPLPLPLLLKPQDLYISILFNSKPLSKKEIEELKEQYLYIDIGEYPLDIDGFSSVSYSGTRNTRIVVGTLLSYSDEVDLLTLEKEFEKALKYYTPKNPFSPEAIRVRIIYQPSDKNYLFKTTFSRHNY